MRAIFLMIQLTWCYLAHKKVWIHNRSLDGMTAYCPRCRQARGYYQ